jgi:NAD(P)-dependent dehydrogenase (short-subunit alcohol dehydrogenase family)
MTEPNAIASSPATRATVLVVGASSGIGKATAQAFARTGAQVIAAVRNPGGCADLREAAAGASAASNSSV